MRNNFKVQDKIKSVTPYIKDIEAMHRKTVQKQKNEEKEAKNKGEMLKILHAELQTATDK